MTGKASIGIVGPYPPPFGGISVHIKRIHKRLSDANYECKVYDECSLGSYALFLPRVPFLREKLLHFHCVNGKVRAVIGLLRLFGKKIVLTIHGESIMQQLKCRGLKKALLIQGLKMINHVICVNGRIAEVLKKSGIADRKISVIPAYIPPKYNNTDYCELPKPVREFLSFQPNEELDSFQANEEVEAQSRKDLIIVANGWIKPMNSASDIYGIRSLIDLAGRLCASDTNTNHFNVRFIIVLLGTGSMSREEKAYHELLVLQASPIIARGNLLIYEPEFTELYPIIERCSIFIRPTLTDGD
jgi:glycosyltransferase involved in cell wall biosynthesis